MVHEPSCSRAFVPCWKSAKNMKRRMTDLKDYVSSKFLNPSILGFVSRLIFLEQTDALYCKSSCLECSKNSGKEGFEFGSSFV